MKEKVLFLLHLPPPIHGSSMIGKYIYQSKLINESFKTDYINLLVSKNVSQSGKLQFYKIIELFVLWFQLVKKIIFFRPQLCYLALTATGLAFFRDALFVITLRLFKVKPIYHMHNKGVSKLKDNKIYDFLYTIVFKNTPIILLSDLLYEDVEKYVNRQNVFVCPNGIPKVEYTKPTNKNDKVTLLFLSNLIESKGVYVLLEACKILKSKNYNFICNFIGGEGDISKQEFEDKVKDFSLTNTVFYLGKKYDEEKYKYFTLSDIFIFPTYYYYETFGLVNVEAMMFELPVISTPEGGIPDIITDNETGFLIPKKNIEVLVSKLEYLFKNPDVANKMGENGRRKFEQEFTLEIFEKRIEAILQNNLQDA